MAKVDDNWLNAQKYSLLRRALVYILIHANLSILAHLEPRIKKSPLLLLLLNVIY